MLKSERCSVGISNHAYLQINILQSIAGTICFGTIYTYKLFCSKSTADSLFRIFQLLVKCSSRFVLSTLKPGVYNQEKEVYILLEVKEV